MAKNNIVIELLYEKIKVLEKRIEKLENDQSKKRLNIADSKIYRQFPLYETEVKRLIDYLDIVYKQYSGEVYMTIEELNHIMNTSLIKEEIDNIDLKSKLHTVSEYFVVLEYDGVYTFNKKKQVGKQEILEYINGLICNCVTSEIEINALKVHKALNLISRMPTVCSAMDALKTEDDIVIAGKNPSSTYTIRYKAR